MPWSVEDPPPCAKNWTAQEKAKCVVAANAVLERGGSEEECIYACIHAAGKTKKDGKMTKKFAATQDEKNAQKARSRRYGISIRDDGNVTKPGQWENVADSQWGDPVNYLYPVPDKTHAANAKSRFQQQKGRYDEKSRQVVMGRLNRLLRKYGLEPIQEKTENDNRLAYLVGEMQLSAEGLSDTRPEGWVRIPAARVATFNTKKYGPLCLDEDLFESLIDNWRSNVLGVDIAIDCNHQPDSGALGWIKDLAVEDGTFAVYGEPTSLGKDQLGSVYRYGSLEFTENYVDPETGISYGPTLLGCAATNRPIAPQGGVIAVLSGNAEMRLYDEAERCDADETTKLASEIDDFLQELEDILGGEVAPLGPSAHEPPGLARINLTFIDPDGNQQTLEVTSVQLSLRASKLPFKSVADGE